MADPNTTTPTTTTAVGRIEPTDRALEKDRPTHNASPQSPACEASLVPTAPVPVTEPAPAPAYSAFSRNQRYLIVALASISATFTGFASNIYFPAIPTIANALGTTEGNVNLTVTSYMVFQALSPTFWGAVSDVCGRRLTLLCTFVVFLGACIGLALSNHLYELIILRCLQSTGSASTIAIGAGMIGDITTREQRGGVMGIFQTGLLAPLAIGPVLGGVFAQTLGWRAIFWFLVIYAGVYLAILVIFLPETLRSIVGNGSVSPYRLDRAVFERWTANRDPEATLERKKVRIDFLAPIRILFEPEVIFVLIYLSVHYASWQMVLTATSSLFKTKYDLNQIQIGLTFLANGAGCMLGTLTTGKLLDHDYRRFKAKFDAAGTENGSTSTSESSPGTVPGRDFPIEHARLRTVWLWSPLEWAAVLVFGWTLDRGVHMAAPIVASFALAWAAMSIQSVITTFLVDIFPASSASATAALNLARCLVGAVATGTVDPAVRTMGIGWIFTLWTALMALSVVFVGVQMRWGGKWRRRREERERAREAGIVREGKEKK